MDNQPLKILYVDDEEDLLALGKIFMERLGNLTVDTSPSAADALEKLFKSSYDGIVSDYQMPGMDGIDLLREVREKYGDIPFILFTGRGREEVVVQAIEFGVDFYVQKGGEPKSQFAELVHKIRHAVRRKNAEHALVQSERMSRALLDATIDAVVLFDRDMIILSVNETFAKRFDRKPEDLIGMGLHELLSPELLIFRQNKVQEVIRTRQILRFEENHDGIFLENNLYPIFDDQGEITSFAVYSRDITEKKKAEKELCLAYERIAADEDVLRANYKELTKSENRIRESEEKFRSLAEHSFDIIMIFDPDLRHLYVNPYVYEQTGIPAKDFIGKTHEELGFPPELTRIFDKTLLDAFHTGEVQRVEFMLPSGIWIDWLVVPVKDHEGTVYQAITSARDITERKRTEDELMAAYEEIAASEEELRQNYQELMKSEAWFRTLFDQTFQFVGVLDLEGRVIQANEAALTLIGGDKNAVLNKPFWETPWWSYDKTSREKIHDAVLRAKSGEIIRFEAIHEDCEGQIHTVDFVIKPILDTNGVPIAILPESRDITELKKKEQEIFFAEERLRKLIDNIPLLAIQGYRLDGTTTYWHDTAEQLYGYSREEAIGKNLLDLIIPPEMRDEVREAIGIMEKTGEPIPAAELLLMRKDGSRVPVYSSHAILTDIKGEKELFCFDIDLRDQKRVLQAIRQANRKLNLLSSITRHDINNQLTILKSGLFLMQNGGTDEENESLLKTICSAVGKIESMIAFTREYEEIGVKEPQWQNVSALISTVMKEPLFSELTWICDIPENLEIFADPLVVKVCYNLVENAIRHGERVTTIRIYITMKGTDLVIMFEDDGAGIKPDEKEKVFEFGYGHNTGMGLPLSREILAITDITIKEIGEGDSGARFEILIPCDKYRMVDGESVLYNDKEQAE